MRTKWLDCYKGFLGLLVVIGHAIVWAGFRDNNSLLTFLFFLIYSFHMPAFFVISGYLNNSVPSLSWLLKRIVNICVPTAVLGVISLVLQKLAQPEAAIFHLAVGIANDYWFVGVLAIIYICFYAVAKTKKITFFLLPSLILMFVTAPYSSFASMFLGYLFCFLLGSALNKYNLLNASCLKSPHVLWALTGALLLSLIGMTICYFSFGSWEIVNLSYYKMIAGAVFSTLLLCLFKFLPISNVLFSGGAVTLNMYLLQLPLGMLYSVVIRLCNSSGQLWLMFLLMIAISYYLPIWIYHFIGKSVLYKLIFSPYQSITGYLNQKKK